MFASAIAKVAKSTLPVVISSRTVAGRNQSTLGACILLNRDGWVATAGHVVGLIEDHKRSIASYRKYKSDIRDFERAQTSHEGHRRKKLRHITKPSKASVRNVSVWFGIDGVQLVDVATAEANDLAVGRLDPFDPERFVHFAVFPDVDKGIAQGTPLCRIGFALQNVVPEWDEKQGTHRLPAGMGQLPLFPLDGILTRVLMGAPPTPTSKPDEKGLFIETSSPGLQGQSGGPIFDVEGRIWGIQSHTSHYPLGFRPKAPGSPMGQVEHQFLNLGVGAHTATLVAMLRGLGIDHQVDA